MIRTREREKKLNIANNGRDLIQFSFLLQPHFSRGIDSVFKNNKIPSKCHQRCKREEKNL
jgi:hypothetical protein